MIVLREPAHECRFKSFAFGKGRVKLIDAVHSLLSADPLSQDQA
jgi:hypothetical protein